MIEKIQTRDYYHKLAQHAFDGMFVMEDTPGTPDGGYALSLWCYYPSMQSIGDYQNDRVNALYDITSSMHDQAEHFKALDEAQKILVEDVPIWINIAESGFHIGVRDDIKGLQWNPLQ